ncbi:site-specific DNA-methyltransferase [Phascolarctobacterium succinatutens]|uniref:site-specific DNA-methyltransferase n=1 Tax=Phascolarctobacterium succinatutens TaxID=626940 RepID=UPI0026F3170A|nr:site-specific DNA-methyltransferase [Phascolarctobacterium succinatutens]
MEHLNMQSMDKVAANVAKIRELFPNCVTERINKEGNLEHAIDFDMLKQELSDHVVDGLQERYQFTWPDKRKAILAANAPINKTLRPCRGESVDFDNTENLYIEGDNLEVLKLLQETYLGKVKMIYIDPPYNTGNDFVYEDDFKQSADEYIDNSGQLDEEGNRLVANTESNGRFHTDWLNMIYPRLKLAKDLLSDDGVIFISIGDDEESNLIKCCNEIFGESNFIASICHKHRASVSNDRIISENHNHLLFYCKNIVSVFRNHKLIGEDPVLEGFNLEDEKGKYKLTPVDGPGGAKKGNPHYDFLGVTGYWRYSKETMQKKYDEGLIVRTTNGLQQKYYLSQASKSRKTVTTWWDDDFLTSSATKMLINLMGDKTFDNPKNINLIIRCLKMIVKFDKDSLILDFFSGSATTAHAVMQLNAEDGGKRKFIMVQLQEECAENSEAYKAGYKNICEIGKERIRRAGQKIKEENPLTTQDLDIGFRVLKCDSSNMEDVYFTPKEYMDKQQSLFVDNIKKDRNDEDLLFDAMLKLDTPLSSKIEKITIAGKTVYNVAQGHLMACFDKNVTDEVITAIAKEMPSYFVMRDSSQADDSVAINFEQIFNTYSPQTVRRVL